MRRKLLLIALFFVVSAACGVLYFQRALPRKLRSVIVDTLQAQTGKKVRLGDAQFNLFKGIVLKEVSIYDESGQLVYFKEGSFVFLIQPFFKKQIIIPSIKIKSAKILLKRNADNTFNLASLLTPKTISRKKSIFHVLIYRVNVLDSQIDFQDNALDPPFEKSFREVNLVLSFVLPAGVKFKVVSEMEGHPVTTLTGWGEYRVPTKELNATFAVNNFSIKELRGYSPALGIQSPEGMVDLSAHLVFKDGLWEIDVESKNQDISFTKDKITVTMDSIVRASLNYSLQDKQLSYSGTVDFATMDISGLEYVGKVQDINGVAKFDNLGFYADKLKANLFGEPVVGRLGLSDFTNPTLDIKINSLLPLNRLQALLKQKANIALPIIIDGEGKVFVSFHAQPKSVLEPTVKGFVDVRAGYLRYGKTAPPVEDIQGRIEFTPDQARWRTITFRFLNTAYTCNGMVDHFQNPDVQLGLVSDEFSLQSLLSIRKGALTIRKFAGMYLDSRFSVRGSVVLKEPPRFPATLTAGLEFDLKDLHRLFARSKGRLDKMKPEGLVRARLVMKGDLNDIKSCVIEAKGSSRRIGVYGLHGTNVYARYSQHNGIGIIPYLGASLYDGTLDATGSFTGGSPSAHYEIKAAVDKLDIAKLKTDTGSKTKELTGIIKADIKADGRLGDLGSLRATGGIRLKNGRLWELNLFRGLGSVLFAKDSFESITFKEGVCDYVIKDKTVLSENVSLKSDIAEIDGPVKIGFDGFLEGKLRVHILDEMVPLSGTFKDITTAIIGQSGIFGVIHASGTLKDPKFKFKPAISSIINGLKNFLFSK